MNIDSRSRPFAVIETVCSPCQECDEEELGLNSRYDHGCAIDHEVGRCRTLAAARMMGGKLAKRTGHPIYVEEDGVGTRWAL